MRVPNNWNGIVLNDLDYVGARAGARSTYWISRGYAVSGIQRHPNRRYQLDPAGEMVNLLTVLDVLESEFGKPRRVIAFGTSAGGQLGLAFAEKYPDRIHGVVVGGATTPVYTSGVRFDVYMVLKALLAPASFKDPSSPLQFLGLPDNSTANVAAWQALFTTASQSPQGLARLALAFTMTQWNQWGATRPDTPDPRNLAAYKLHLRELAIRLHQPHVNTQFLFETQLGVWMGNDGADYKKYWDNADPGFKVAVAQLYQEAGLDLNAEIAQVNAMPRFPMNDAAHHAAYAYWMGDAARTQRGKPNPKIPVFRMHTIGDPQVVASQMQVYNDQIRRNRLTPIYRTAYVEREGHITFTVAEYAAAMEVMNHRLDTGVWPNTSAIALNQLAQSLNAGSGAQAQSRFIEYFYRPFNGEWRLDYPGNSPAP
jgi:pimeloyl-ACP methyl ester carboxylesterase